MKHTALYLSAGAVAVLAAGAACASAYTGYAVTARLSEQAASFEQLLPGARAPETIEHGVFRSTRSIALQLGCVPVRAADGKSYGKTAPVGLHWRDTIHHVKGLIASDDDTMTDL